MRATDGTYSTRKNFQGFLLERGDSASLVTNIVSSFDGMR